MYIAIIIAAVIILAACFYFMSKKSGARNGTETDASMFARLLVSEVKLFNEAKVQQAQQNNNLSDALRDEIGQARQTFQKRFPNPESAAHFENALIEILADGDRNRLNSGIKSSFR